MINIMSVHCVTFIKALPNIVLQGVVRLYCTPNVLLTFFSYCDILGINLRFGETRQANSVRLRVCIDSLSFAEVNTKHNTKSKNKLN
jgi:hypothetical protein